MQKNKPCISHINILNLQEHFWLKSQTVITLVTQNIDSYHADLLRQSKICTQENDLKFGFTTGVIEMHGNLRFMRCTTCKDGFKETPKNTYEIPLCPKCRNVMHPHCLFFDEEYDTDYYQSNLVRSRANSCEAMIIIGTALETNLARSIVEKQLIQDKLIVEINPEPILQFGNVMHIKLTSDEALTRLVKTMRMNSEKIDENKDRNLIKALEDEKVNQALSKGTKNNLNILKKPNKNNYIFKQTKVNSKPVKEVKKSSKQGVKKPGKKITNYK